MLLVLVYTIVMAALRDQRHERRSIQTTLVRNQRRCWLLMLVPMVFFVAFLIPF